MAALHKPKWDDPLSSIGDFRGMIEIKTARLFKGQKFCWEAKDGSPASTALIELLPRINDLFQAAGNRVPASAMLLMDVFMIGESAEESVPYIMFSCPNTCKGARIEAMNLVKRSGLLRNFPGLRISHWEFPPHIPDLEPTNGSHTYTIIPSLEDIFDTDECDTDEYDIDECDESLIDSTRIGHSDRAALKILLTYKGDANAFMFQKSTEGTIIRFGECVLYFTAAHILLPQRDGTSQRQSLAIDLNLETEGDSDYTSKDDSSAGFANGESVEPSRMCEQNPTPSGQDIAICEPSPSLSSATGDFDTHTEVGQPSLVPTVSRPLQLSNGEVFFKSHELDFVLLDLSDLAASPRGISQLDFNTVSTIRTGFTEVVACTTSGRRIRGEMSSRSSYIRFPHGAIYQEVYPVFSRVELQTGDSGTIVCDAATGKVYGHIVVASITSRTAFIVPATQVLRSIPWLAPGALPIYTRLDTLSGQIRLVRLLPPSLSGDCIQCELTPAFLRDQPKYQSLSYAWGNQDEYKPIILNGQPWKVSRRLANILLSLRTAGRDGLIWIDALCIDQTDSAERSGQVQLMNKIFKESDLVTVFLDGMYDEASSFAEWELLLKHASMDRCSKP